MRGVGLAAALVAITGGVPVPVPAAIEALREAHSVSTSSTCLSTRESIPGQPDSTTAYCEGGGLLIDSGPDSTVLVMPDGHGYAAIPRDVVRDVQAYLDAQVTWFAMRGFFGGQGSFIHDSKDRAAIDVPPPRSFASAHVNADGHRYRLRDAGISVTYTIDAAGRLSSADWRVRRDHRWTRVSRYDSVYEGITIPVLPPEQVLPQAVVWPAILTARIPQRLRRIVRAVMADGHGPVAQLRRVAADLVRLENRGVPAPARLHAHPTRHGVRITARNQYTSQTFEWRVVDRNGHWRAQRVT